MQSGGGDMPDREREIKHQEGLREKHIKNIRRLEMALASLDPVERLGKISWNNALEEEKKKLQQVEERLEELRREGPEETTEEQDTPVSSDRQEEPAETPEETDKTESVEPPVNRPVHWEKVGATAGVIVLLIALGWWLVTNAGPYLFGTPTSVAVLPTFTSTLTDTSVPTPGIGSVKTNPKDGVEMVHVPAGEFIMGSSDADIDAVLAECTDCEREWYDAEKPQHTVYLDAFWVYKTEVTNDQYRKCVEAGACTPPHYTWRYNDPAYTDDPVISVDWYQAKAYCEWAGGRLPTEAEWEKAARGMDGRIYPWGNDWDANKLNSYEAGPGNTIKVGSYLAGASPYGALDMAGNVWEWTNSLYMKYPYRADDDREALEASGARISRGGAWDSSQRLTRCAFRNADAPSYTDYLIGFRVVVPGS